MLDDAGDVTGVLGFAEDITHQKLAEEAVLDSEERYRLLFQYSPIALIERDASQLKAYIEQWRLSGVTERKQERMRLGWLAHRSPNTHLRHQRSWADSFTESVDCRSDRDWPRAEHF